MKKEEYKIEDVIEYLEGRSDSKRKNVTDEYAAWISPPIYTCRCSVCEEPLVMPSVSGYFSLVIVEKGKLNIQLDVKCDEISEGMGVGITHSTGFKLIKAGEDKTEISIMLFSLSIIFSYGTTVVAAKFGMPFINMKPRVYDIFGKSSEISGEIVRLTHEIMKYMDETPYGYELIVKARMCEMWYLIVRAFTKVAPAGETKSISKDEKRVKKAINYIESHYSEQLTLDDIASNINICKSECCRCFKRVLGISPIEYVVRYRVYTAAFFLDMQNDDTEIATLAVKVGFANVSYFNRSFKKYIGYTPSEYKKRVYKDVRIEDLRGNGIIL